MSQHLPTIEEVEQSGELVCARKSGFHPNRVMDWRKSGRLKKGRDCENKRVRITERLHAATWFYRPASLEREAKKDQLAKVPHSKKMLLHWKALERIEEPGATLLRQNAAAKYLGVRKQTLLTWTNGECTWRADNKPLATTTRSHAGSEYTYWFLAELDEVNEAKRHHARIAFSDATYDLATTAAKTGLPLKTLRKKKERRKLGLKTVLIPIAVPCSRQEGKPGKDSWTRQMNAIAFARESVDQFAKVEAPRIPQDRLGSIEAARELLVSRFGLSLSSARALICRWVNAEVLDGKEATIPTNSGAKPGWIITRASIDAVKKITASARDTFEAGRMLRAAKKSGELDRLWSVDTRPTASAACVTTAQALNGHTSPAKPEAANGEPDAEPVPTKGKRSRGRPVGRGEATQAKYESIRDDHKAGKYDSITTLAKAHHVSRTLCSLVLSGQR